MMTKVEEKHPILGGIYTSVTKTGYDIYHELSTSSKFDKFSIELVHLSDTSCNDCDILVCSSLQALLNIRPYLNESMHVIVCDGPLIVSCLAAATPLDYIRRLSYKFEFRPIQYGELLKAVRGKSPTVRLDLINFDVIGIVTENSMQGGLILSELNKVQSYFDALARNRLRFLLTQLLQAEEAKSHAVELQKFLSTECRNPTHKSDAKALWNKLFKKGIVKKLRAALREVADGKNINTIAKKHDISVFELTYLRKMFKNIDTAAARTTTYNSRTKTIEARA